MTADELKEIQRFVAEHPDRQAIEMAAEVLRKHLAGPHGVAMQIAIALVGAELAHAM